MNHCLVNIPENTREVIEEPLKDGITVDNLVNIVAYVAPRLVPNISSNKREDIIPLLISVIKLHPNSVDRNSFVDRLFSLQNKPSVEDRKMILAGECHKYIFI